MLKENTVPVVAVVVMFASTLLDVITDMYSVGEKRQLGRDQRHCGGYDRDVPRDYKPGDSMCGRQVSISHLSHFSVLASQ